MTRAYETVQTGETIETRWELATYDVWGNARDGFEVNNTFRSGTADIELAVEIHNAGTEYAFRSASPTDQQIREAFGMSGKTRIETDGDDVTIYVTRERDGYPLGEMRCVSHSSLSPIGKQTDNN